MIFMIKLENAEVMGWKKTITIFTASKARELLKDGRFTLIDIKPDKTDPDGKRSVFVFKNENGLLEKIKSER